MDVPQKIKDGLKGCAFCGAPAHVQRMAHDLHADIAGKLLIECCDSQCGVSTRLYILADWQAMKDVWNRRPPIGGAINCSALIEHILDIPRRREMLGGQLHSYVQVDEVVAWIEHHSQPLKDDHVSARPEKP